MADNETIADIVAEKRRQADKIERNCAEMMKRGKMISDCYVSDLVADIRREADRIEAAWKRERENYDAKIADLQLRVKLWTDRYDELVEKCVEQYAKLKQVGNSAKLREALKLCLRGMCGYCRMDAEARGMTTECVNGCEALLMAKAALAAPPRNCDKYATADEALKAQEQMFNDSNFANGECKLGCPECDNPRVGCKIAWLFAPATEKEGGNDADK